MGNASEGSFFELFVKQTGNSIVGGWGGPSAGYFYDNYPFKPNEWNLITYSTSQDSAYLYINGNKMAARLYNGGASNSITLRASNNFCQFGSPDWYDGYLDDIVLHNRALSPAEVQQLYNANTYAWSTGETTPSINVTPAQTTTYYCTVSNGNQS
jgi:hypothetical protein